MRILQTCAVDFTAYHFLLPLMRACREDGWTVELACANGPWIGALEAEGFRHWRIPMTRSRSIGSQMRAMFQLARSLRCDPPQLLHTHTPVGGLIGRLASFAVPRMPVVHTLHGLPLRSERPSGIERPFLVLEQIAARRTSHFFSQAASDVPRAAALGILRPEVTTVIGNGVDTRRFAPDGKVRAEVRLELGVPEEALLIVSVGRLVREKGILEFADAVAACADLALIHVIVVGDALPSDRTSVTEELHRHPVVGLLGPRWRALGYRADVDRILKAADVFVLASHREGLPRSVVEAMACGLPVIATDIPAHRELVELGVTGWLVPVSDGPALASVLRRVARDPGTLESMGTRARARALERHREEDVVARQLPTLRRIAARS